ncbi:hypothetical protein ACRRTK_015539 [Alexandromys fortis]
MRISTRAGGVSRGLGASAPQLGFGLRSRGPLGCGSCRALFLPTSVWGRQRPRGSWFPRLSADLPSIQASGDPPGFEALQERKGHWDQEADIDFLS